MATEVESVVSAASSKGGSVASEGGGAVVANPDPHAQCRIDNILYLVIGESGEYNISMVPIEIPEGVWVEPVANCKKGLRQFNVYRDGMDTYDFVTVGTFMIQNGYAYIAGHFIHGEAPDPYYEFVEIPPFKITYPRRIPDGMSEEQFFKELTSKIRSDLERIISYYHPTGLRVLDFHLGRPCDIDKPNLCGRCNVQLYEGGSSCDDCDEVLYGRRPCSDVSSSINHKGCGGDKVETLKGMDIDDEEDNYNELGGKLGKCDLVN